MSDPRKGRTRNTHDEASVFSPITVGKVTSVKLADANEDRLFIEFNILPNVNDVSVFIRLYPASQDNDARGVWMGRFNMGNDTFFRPFWRMEPDNIYTGEISAIIIAAVAVTEDVYVTEY